jgi:hypothetical protein
MLRKLRKQPLFPRNRATALLATATRRASAYARIKKTGRPRRARRYF